MHGSGRRTGRYGIEGFSLIELIIALLLSTFVLIGVVGVAAQMIRFQMEATKHGEVTGWVLLSLVAMQRQLEGASVLYCPNAANGACLGGDETEFLSGCTNYSRHLSQPIGVGLRIDASKENVSFYYCVDDDKLLRYEKKGTPTSCPISPTPVCGSGNFKIIASHFYQIDANTEFFARAQDIAGVELRFMIGIATPTPNIPIPVVTTFRTKVGMNKSYLNDLD